MLMPTSRPLRFLSAAAIVAVAYVVSEKLQLLMFSLGPSLKPVYDHLTKGWMLALFFVWFLLLAIVAAFLSSFVVRRLWRWLGLRFSFLTALGIAVFVAVAWECIDQIRLARFEEYWTFSILNLQRAGLLLAFPIVLAWVCSRGPNKGMQATAYGGA